MAFIPLIKQDRLDSVFLLNNTIANTAEKCVVTNALRSDVNAGFLQKKLMGEDAPNSTGMSGQKVKLELAWKLPDCEPVTMGCVTDPCATGDAPTGHEKEDYNIVCTSENTFSASKTYNYNEYLEATVLMDSLPDLAAPLNVTAINGTSIEADVLEMFSKLDLAVEKYNAETLVDAVDVTNFGFSYDEFPSLTNLTTDKGKAVKTFGAGAAIETELFNSIMESTQMADFNGVPMVFGGYPAQRYINLSGGLCCASNGINLGDVLEVNKMAILRSDSYSKAMIAKYPSLAGALSNMPFLLAVDRGAVQILNYHTFAGKFGMKNGITTRTQVFSPFTGNPYGMTVTMSNCGTSVTVRLQTTQDLVFRPATACTIPSYNTPNGLQQFVIKN